MQRLQIPFSRHTQTTRRYRRVVWLLGFVALGVVIVIWSFTTTWITRDLTSRATPEGTVLTLRFLANRHTWDQLEQALGGIPLITDRSVTLHDLKPFISGEFSIFFLADGSQAVAIRTQKGVTLSSEWLDALGIVRQEPIPNVFLLSHKLVSIEEPTQGRFHLPPLPIFDTRLGYLRLQEGEETIAGVLRRKKGNVTVTLSIPFPKQVQEAEKPEKDTAILSTLAWTEGTVGGLLEPVRALLGPLETLDTQEFIKRLEENSHLSLSTDGQRVTFVLDTAANNLSLEEGEDLIRLLAALHMPVLRSWTLPDGSKSQELWIDPSLVTVEQGTLLGNPSIQASANTHTFLLTTAKDRVWISNNQELLENQVKQEQKQNRDRSCVPGTLSMDISSFARLFEGSGVFHSRNTLTTLSQNTTFLVIGKGIFGKTIVTLCGL